ncbi:hypothetical protein BgiBS90_019407, partial [Biomphalaria glabrata]
VYLSEALKVDTSINLKAEISTKTWTVDLICTWTDMPNYEGYVDWYRHTENSLPICRCSFTSTVFCYPGGNWEDRFIAISNQTNNAILTITMASYSDQDNYICKVSQNSPYVFERSSIQLEIP